MLPPTALQVLLIELHSSDAASAMQSSALTELLNTTSFSVQKMSTPSEEESWKSLKPDVFVIYEDKLSERLWSVVSEVRAFPCHLQRPILVLCSSVDGPLALERATGLGVQFFMQPDALMHRLTQLSEPSSLEWNETAVGPCYLQRLFDSGHHSDCLKHIQKMSEAQRLAVDSLPLAAAIWLHEDNTGKAEQALRSALDANPEHVPVRNQLARTTSRLGRYNEALSILERHPMAPFQETLSLLTTGHLALESADHARADRSFSLCQQRDKLNRQAELGLGKIAFARGQLNKAAQHFINAGRSDELASYFNQMGVALVNQQRYDDALAIYQNALKVLPSGDKQHFLHYNIGLAQRKKGALLEAAAAFAAALALVPHYAKAVQNLSEVLRLAEKQGIPENALKKFQGLITKRNSD